MAALTQSVVEGALGCRAEALDADLLAHRLGLVCTTAAPDELDRQPAARVARRLSGPVLPEPPLRIGRPAAVERSVGAFEQVDPGHASLFDAGTGGPLSAPRGSGRTRVP